MDEVYRTRYVIAVGEDVRDFELLIGADPDTLPQDAAYTQWLLDKDEFIVRIVFGRHVSYGMIAHECNHAVNMTFKHHGTKLDIDNDEHQSYYLEHLVNKVVEAFDDFDKRKSKALLNDKRKTK